MDTSHQLNWPAELLCRHSVGQEGSSKRLFLLKVESTSPYAALYSDPNAGAMVVVRRGRVLLWEAAKAKAQLCAAPNPVLTLTPPGHQGLWERLEPGVEVLIASLIQQDVLNTSWRLAEEISRQNQKRGHSTPYPFHAGTKKRKGGET